MKMDRVCEELDEAKAEIEKLKLECRIKTDLSENLKKAHSELFIKIQEAGWKIEKQAQELNEKVEEISVAKRMYEDLKYSLIEEESIVKHLNSVNDKLRVDCDEKTRKWEGETREMVSALDEANEKRREQEHKISAYEEEIEGLKRLLSVSQKKCLEAEKRAKASEEVKQREDMLLNLEEEKRKVEDQLKWKKEQFKHLEEAHKKVQDKFRASKEEWESEKSTLVEEISSLQTSLDSQTKISDDLQVRLQRCNHALAHEESQRKCLEVQLSESKLCFENAFTECQEENSKTECLTLQRDKEIAALRNSLGSKEMFFKEMEYQRQKLEQENQELRLSLKELQEAQISQSGTSSSLSKLRNKLKRLEQINKESSVTLSTKEAEWSSQLEKLRFDLNNCKSESNTKDNTIKELRLELESQELVHKDCSVNLIAKQSQLNEMTGELNNYRSDLELKDKVINELNIELESCHFSIMELKVQNEEISLLLTVYKTGFTEAESKLEKARAELDLLKNERDEKISLLTKQLEAKNAALAKAQIEIEEECEKVASLLRRFESFNYTEKRQKELEERLREACDALDRADSELTEKIFEGNELRFEMQIWKSIAERLKVDLEESQAMRREVEDSLLAQVEVEVMLKQEKVNLAHMVEEREKEIDILQQRLESLKTRETGTSDALMINQLEIEKRTELEDTMKISSEKENLLGDICGLCDRISEKPSEDAKLMGVLEKIGHEELIPKENDGLNCMKESQNAHLSPIRKKLEAIADQRSPFRELNSLQHVGK